MKNGIHSTVSVELNPEKGNHNDMISFNSTSVIGVKTLQV